MQNESIKTQIYRYERQYQQHLQRLDKEPAILPENKETIREFLERCIAQANKSTKKILDKLEVDFPFRFVLLPLNSLLHMAELFIKDAPVFLPAEDIIEFFQNKRYITAKQMEELHSKLKKVSDVDSPLFRYIQENVAKYGA